MCVCLLLACGFLGGGLGVLNCGTGLLCVCAFGTGLWNGNHVLRRVAALRTAGGAGLRHVRLQWKAGRVKMRVTASLWHATITNGEKELPISARFKTQIF